MNYEVVIQIETEDPDEANNFMWEIADVVLAHMDSTATYKGMSLREMSA